MKTKTKLSAYILRGSMGALLLSGVIVALCSAINLPGANGDASAASGAASVTGTSRPLSFAERVVYQRAIEDVYWRHRIWPKTNPGPKPPLDAVMSQADIEKKVEAYLRNSQTLEAYGQRPITAEQLQAEMVRMAIDTKQPEVLRELFEALRNDPFVIAECLVRPILTDRLIADASAQDKAGRVESLGSTEFRTVSIAPMSGLVAYTLPVIASDGCVDDTWTATSTANVPVGRHSLTAVWTGTEMIVWGGSGGLNTGGRYEPSTDSWTDTSTTNAPVGRAGHTAVWTGSEMIVWGGYDASFHDLNTGGRYDPSTDSWTSTSTTNAPTGRESHTAIWTGSEMWVWGGYDGRRDTNTLGQYDPSTDSWSATGTTNAPAARDSHSAVWTGDEMIVWGGWDDNGTPLNTGGILGPNGWRPTSVINAPSARYVHAAVWDDSDDLMIVWGGYDNSNYLNTGGRYDPVADSWTDTNSIDAPAGRRGPRGVWTGSEMIVWGGYNAGAVNAGEQDIPDAGGVNSGGRYNPITDSWVPTSLINAPSARYLHAAVWTGSEMIIWGGFNLGSYPVEGGRYCAASGASQIVLTARTRPQPPNCKLVQLTWTGANAPRVDVYRNGIQIAQVPSHPGRFRDTLCHGGGQTTYQVCEPHSNNCSNTVTVRGQP